MSNLREALDVETQEELHALFEVWAAELKKLLEKEKLAGRCRSKEDFKSFMKKLFYPSEGFRSKNKLDEALAEMGIFSDAVDEDNFDTIMFIREFAVRYLRQDSDGDKNEEEFMLGGRGDLLRKFLYT